MFSHVQCGHQCQYIAVASSWWKSYDSGGGGGGMSKRSLLSGRRNAIIDTWAHNTSHYPTLGSTALLLAPLCVEWKTFLEAWRVLLYQLYQHKSVGLSSTVILYWRLGGSSPARPSRSLSPRSPGEMEDRRPGHTLWGDHHPSPTHQNWTQSSSSVKIGNVTIANHFQVETLYQHFIWYYKTEWARGIANKVIKAGVSFVNFQNVSWHCCKNIIM